MTVTPLWLTGFEHGAALATGSGLFDAVTGAATIDTTAPRHGSYRGLCTIPASTACAFQKNVAGTSKFALRAGVKFVTLPASGVCNFLTVQGADAVNAAMRIDQNGLIQFGAFTGPTITDNNWHLIEMQVDLSANPRITYWRIDEVVYGPLSAAVTASTAAIVFLGQNQTNQAQALTVAFDDVICASITTAGGAGGEWIGDGLVLAQLAGSDGTHSTDSDFSPGDAGTAYAGTTIAYQMVDDAPASSGWTATRSTTDNDAQRTAGTAFLEIAPATTAQGGSANAVRALMSYSSPSTAGNTAACIVRNSGGTEDALLGATGAPVSWAVSANNFKGVTVTKPVAGWTATEVNALRFRFGWSNDIAPVPTIQALMLEVDWPLVAVSKTAADSVTVSDAVVRAAGFPRTAADSVSVSDVAAEAFKPHDSVSVGDSAGVVLGPFSRAALDTVGIADSVVRAHPAARSSADTVAVSDSSSRAPVLPRSAGDTVTVSDAVTVGTMGHIRGSSDVVTLIDSAALNPLARTAADTVTISDASLRVKASFDSMSVSDAAVRGVVGLARSPADTVAVSDAAAKALHAVRQALDNLVVSDASSPTAQARTAQDTLTTGGTWPSPTLFPSPGTYPSVPIFGLQDFAIAAAGPGRIAADSVSIADAAVRSTFARPRTAHDTLTLTDAASPVATLHKTAGDTLIVSDVAVRVLSGRTASDTVTVSDAASRLTHQARTSTASVAIADNSVSFFSPNPVAVDNIGLVVDSADRTLFALTRSSADTVPTISDASVAAPHSGRTVADTVTVSDATVRAAQPFTRAGADTVVIATDTALAGHAFARSSADTVTIMDASVQARGLPRSSSDTVATISDAAAVAAQAKARSSSDTITFADQAVQGHGNARDTSDAFTVTDTAGASGIGRRAADTLTISDAVALVKTLHVAAADVVVVVDLAGRLVTRARAAADTLTIADAAAGAVALARSSSDTLSISDSTVRLDVLVRASSDSVVVADSAGRALHLSVTADDSVSVTDAAVRSRGSARTAADSVSVSDATVRGAVAHPRAAADLLAVSDVARKVFAGGRSSSDTLTVTDAAAPRGVRVRSSADSVAVADNTTIGPGAVSVFSFDATPITDVARRIFHRSLTASDTHPIFTDSSAIIPPGRLRGATDTLTLSDVSVRAISGVTIGAHDAVTLSDFSRPGRAFVRAAADTVAVSDTSGQTIPVVVVYGRVTTGLATSDGLTGIIPPLY